MEGNNGSEEEHKFTLDNYHIVEQVRRGKSTSDFVVLHQTEDKKYSMKKISLAKHTDKLKQTAFQEMRSLSKLKDPYIVHYEDSWIDKEDNACIFTSYCEGGNMANAIKKARGKLFSEEKIFKWFAQLLLAVNYLHSNRVLHMDLTCANILLPKDDHIQLGNYGLAKLINPENPTPSVSGIPNSMSPEVLENEPYGYKSDIWSLGCCMYEITSHQPVFKSPDKATLINKINRSLMSPLPIVYSSTLKQMIKIMLRKKPEHRPTACEMLRNPSLQPYLLQCQNLSPIYLPVFPIDSPKDKTRRSSLPGKFAKERDSREKSDVSRSLENLYPYWTKADETGSSSSSKGATEENKPETKRIIDPNFEDNNNRMNVSVSTTTEESLLCDVVDAEEEVIFSLPSDIEEAETLKTLPDPEMFIPSTEVAVAKSLEANEAKPVKLTSAFPDVDVGVVSAEEVICSLPSAIEEAETREQKDPRKVTIPSTEVASPVKLTESEVSSVLLSKLGRPQSKERADALECLLEKCASLIKQEKYEEVAGLLTPFGEEGVSVSARDTAIWFAKTLLSPDKHN